eukprot:SAG22_NODE_10405_length_537_cov_0.821918_1_plen_170_part_10
MPSSLQLLCGLCLGVASAAVGRRPHRVPPLQPRRVQAPAGPALIALPLAPQRIYLQGTPHTTKVGVRRNTFDPSSSFFPLALYHAITESTPWPGQNYSCSDFAAAGFNTLHFWEGQALEVVIKDARKAGLQLIPHISPGNPEGPDGVSCFGGPGGSKGTPLRPCPGPGPV